MSAIPLTRTGRNPEVAPPQSGGPSEFDHRMTEDYLRTGGLFLPEDRTESLNLKIDRFSTELKIGTGNVLVTMSVPSIMNPLSNPALIKHGYCAKLAYDEFRDELARNGKPAITVETPRDINIAGTHPKHLFDPLRQHAQTVWAGMKAGVLLAEEARIDIPQKYDLIGHSLGGSSVTDSAYEHPGWVNSVILFEAAGMYKHSTASLAKNLPLFFAKEMLPLMREKQDATEYINSAKLVLNSLKYITCNPLRTALEGISISNRDNRPKFMELGKLGIKTAILVAESDTLISARKTWESNGNDTADIFATLVDQKANHLAPQRQSVAAALATLQILDRLNGTNEHLDIAA